MQSKSMLINTQSHASPLDLAAFLVSKQRFTKMPVVSLVIIGSSAIKLTMSDKTFRYAFLLEHKGTLWKFNGRISEKSIRMGELLRSLLEDNLKIAGQGTATQQ